MIKKLDIVEKGKKYDESNYSPDLFWPKSTTERVLAEKLNEIIDQIEFMEKYKDIRVRSVK